ncbi:MAG: O-antigen ligase family protein [Pseudomonadota bacterium]
MKIIVPLIILYLSLFLLWGLRDMKKFLLFTGVFTIPFGIDYGLIQGEHIGWVSGVFVRLSDLSFLLLPVIWLAGKGKNLYLMPEIAAPTAAFMLACMLSIFNSTAGGFSGYQIVQIATTFLCYSFLAGNVMGGEDDLRMIVRFLLVSLLFQSLLSIFQFQTALDLSFRTGSEVSFMTINDEGYVRSFGTIGRPNAFGGYVVPLILLAEVAAMAAVEKKRRATLTWLTMLLGVLALIFCFSRGAWISFTVGNLFLTTVALKRGLPWLRRLLVAQFAVVAAIAPFSLLIMERAFGYDAGAAASRWPLMKLAWNMIVEHPVIGVGINTFLNVAPYYITRDIAGAWVGEVHNMYLLIFAEAGLLGLLAFLWLMGSFYFQAARLSRAEEPFLAALGLGGMAALVAVATHMFVDMFTGSILLDLLFLLGALMVAGNRLRRLSPASEQPCPAALEHKIFPVAGAAA